MTASVYLIDTSQAQFGASRSFTPRLFKAIRDVLKLKKQYRESTCVYYNLSESLLGNIRDCLVFATMWSALPTFTLHLHGGAGMRRLLSIDNRVLRWINSRFLRRVGAIIVLGDRLKSIYKGVVPPELLHSVPNFASGEFFVSDEDVRKKFASPPVMRVLFLSNLLPGKGHMELLGALKLLTDEVKHGLHIDFAGGFESVTQEREFRTELDAIAGLSSRVHGKVAGEVKRCLLKDAHVFCLPTYYAYEGQPISILEAFASGCAVVTTDHSGIFDTFTPGVNGIEVQARSAASLATALVSLHAEQSSAQAYAFENVRVARARFRVDRHLEALERIIWSVQPLSHSTIICR
jgi:glycosyltransferase involved in cell wall biosynthesis